MLDSDCGLRVAVYEVRVSKRALKNIQRPEILNDYAPFINPNSKIDLLVPKTVLVSAIRALPCDAVTRHSPYIFLHTFLADKKAAPTGPAKWKYSLAAMALRCFHSAAFFPVGCPGFGVCH